MSIFPSDIYPASLPYDMSLLFGVSRFKAPFRSPTQITFASSAYIRVISWTMSSVSLYCSISVTVLPDGKYAPRGTTVADANDNDPFVPFFHLWLYNRVQASVPDNCYAGMSPAIMSDEIWLRVITTHYDTAVPREKLLELGTFKAP